MVALHSSITAKISLLVSFPAPEQGSQPLLETLAIYEITEQSFLFVATLASYHSLSKQVKT